MSALFLAFFSALLSKIMERLLQPKGTAEKQSPYYELQHPATEELRALYREIDREAEIRDPDLVTPEKPPVGSQLIFSGSGAQLGSFPPAGGKPLPAKEARMKSSQEARTAYLKQREIDIKH